MWPMGILSRGCNSEILFFLKIVKASFDLPSLGEGDTSLLK